MATNKIHDQGTQLYVTVGSGVTSGQAVVVGQIPGVALYDADANNKAVIQTDGVFNLSVKGENNAGNIAVAEGDILYKDGALINKDVTNGVRFGYALEAVGSGATETIKVKIGY